MGAAAGGIDPITGRTAGVIREAANDKEPYEDWLMSMVITYGVEQQIPANLIQDEPIHKVIAAVSAKHMLMHPWAEKYSTYYTITEKAQRYLSIVETHDKVVEPQSEKEI